jgi:hypothetical protein
MRLLHRKSEPERLLDAVSDLPHTLRSGNSGTILKAALVVGGLAALTAGSAAISSLRRRIERNS